MSSPVDQVKQKVNAMLDKYPVIDEPIKKLAAQTGVDKAFIALGALLIPVLIVFTIGAGEFVMYSNYVMTLRLLFFSPSFRFIVTLLDSFTLPINQSKQLKVRIRTMIHNG